MHNTFCIFLHSFRILYLYCIWVANVKIMLKLYFCGFMQFCFVCLWCGNDTTITITNKNQYYEKQERTIIYQCTKGSIFIYVLLFCLFLYPLINPFRCITNKNYKHYEKIRFKDFKRCY